MPLPLVDPISIRDEVTRLVERLEDLRDSAGTPGSPEDTSEQRRLSSALADALDTLHRRECSVERDSGESEPSLGELGDHALDLLTRLAYLARSEELAAEADALERLTLPLACCIARGGGELTHIAPVVNAVASLAGELRDPEELLGLFRMADDVFHAVSIRVSDSAGGSEASRSWRLLVIHRAILATRTQETVLMEQAFDALLEQAPEAAVAFFREGIEQMDARGYPPTARLVMQRYYEACGRSRRLH
jgi:hypothetical protein